MEKTYLTESEKDFVGERLYLDIENWMNGKDVHLGQTFTTNTATSDGLQILHLVKVVEFVEEKDYRVVEFNEKGEPIYE